MERWLTRGVIGHVLWPPNETTIVFGGHELLLKPATRDCEESISICLKNIDEKEAIKLFNQFLSILCWCDDGQHAQLIYGGIGICPTSVGRARKTGSAMFGAFEAFNRNLIDDPKKRLALALYREAVTIKDISLPYSFLGFFRIIGVCLGENKETSNKIAEIIPKLNDGLSIFRIKDLKADDTDIPNYLYTQRRCAISHVTNDPVLNPDEEDSMVLSGDVYIVRAIAEYLIENELKISRTILSDKHA